MKLWEHFIMFDILVEYKCTDEHISCTLRSWVHDIFSYPKTVSPQLGDKCVSKCSSDSFPRTKYTSSCVANSQNLTFMFHCSLIPGRRFEKQGKIWERFVPQFFSIS